MYSGGRTPEIDMESLHGTGNERQHAHMTRITEKMLRAMPMIEMQKRLRGLERAVTNLSAMNEELMNYDETYVAPFITFHMMTTLNNLSMLDPRIVYTPSEIGYNEDLSLAWSVYENRETGEWVKITVNGTNYECKLETSNNTTWENVGWSDIMPYLAKFYQDSTLPTTLVASLDVPFDERLSPR